VCLIAGRSYHFAIAIWSEKEAKSEHTMKTNALSLLLIPMLVSFAPLPAAQAVSPAPDGGYPGGNTAEGQNALLGLTNGTYNTAVGLFSLLGNTTGSLNTALGAGTLLANTGSNNTATGAGVLLNNTAGTSNTADGAFALFNNSTGSGNIAIGYQAGLSLTTGNNNIDIASIGVAGESNVIRIGDPGIHAAIFMAGITAVTPAAPNQAVLVDPATGQLGSADIASFGVVSTSPENTAVGDQALVSNTGEFNTATGFQALFSNTDGDQNTATGDQALVSNLTGANNTALGTFALSSNTTGQFNNAVGANSLFFNGDGSSNNAVGESALLSNLTASANTAIGDVALANNDSSGTGDGSLNTAVGAGALFSNVDGNSNNAVGFDALGSNTIGVYNNAIGFEALGNNISGSSNIALGDSAGLNVTTASNVICIGAGVDGANVSNSCYIGSIFGETTSGGAAVFINSSGQLGTATSSRRFKEEIKSMDDASAALFALKPVTFRYKREIDAAGIQQFGLVAEDVQRINPDLVVRDKNGNAYSVRYDQVNAMLLNEFLKEHRKNEEQEATITQLRKELQATAAHQQKQIEALTNGLQKVSAQLEATSPSRRTAGGLEASKFAAGRIRSGGPASQVVNNP
jgi:trimeric autotransporter adhesin